MRRFLTASLLVIAILAALAPAASAHHKNIRCPQHWWMGTWHVQEQIKCFANHHNLSVSKALDVARCESGFDPNESYGRFVGVYQIGDTEWNGWYMPWIRWSGYPKQAPRTNGRANIAVALYHVHHKGWSAWSCA